MQYKFLVLPLLCSLPLHASATLTYLDCLLEHQGKSIKWEVGLNEQAGTVSIKAAGVGPIVERARFWSDRVQWGVDDAYTISRVDLSLRFDEPSGKVSRGQCQLAQPEARKF